MFRLAPHRGLERDTEPRQILPHRRLEFRPAARRVDVLDAQQQASARGARHLEVQERAQRVPEMQKTVGARREAEHRARHYGRPSPGLRRPGLACRCCGLDIGRPLSDFHFSRSNPPIIPRR
jgi:hypothetical protein